jgi:hypothetical protein
VAENSDRATFDEEKSQRGDLIDRKGSGEQIDYREIQNAVGQKNFVEIESCVCQVCPEAKDNAYQDKCGESMRAR